MPLWQTWIACQATLDALHGKQIPGILVA